MDRRLGLPFGALSRLLVGLGSLVALTYHFPQLTAPSQEALLFTTVLIGMSYGVAFGTSYQIASKYPSGATVALTTGFVSSGPVVLLLDLALKRGPFYSKEGLEQLFRYVSAITAAGLLSATALVLGSWRMLSAASPSVSTANGSRPERQTSYKDRSGKDGSEGTYGYATHATERSVSVRHRTENAYGDPMYGTGPGGSVNGHHAVHNANHGHHAITLDFGSHGHGHGHGHHDGHGGGHGSSLYGRHSGGGAPDIMDGVKGGALLGDDSKAAKKDLPFLRLAYRILPACISISISVGTSMLIFPFFTYMRSTGLMGVRFPQVLFYIRLTGDILGRMVPRRMQCTTVRGLMFWAFVKLAMVPLLFGCIYVPHLTGGDVAACVVVALFWVLSGYLNTCSYLVAPTLVPPNQKGRASGLMTVAFQSACFGALLLAALVQQMKLGEAIAAGVGLVPPAEHAAAVAALEALAGAGAAAGAVGAGAVGAGLGDAGLGDVGGAGAGDVGAVGVQAQEGLARAAPVHEPLEQQGLVREVREPVPALAPGENAFEPTEG
ncbi:hypothetical protein HYH03_001915 [Edaphochlamys debaryana]|uniref:Uncharacterized protein n=1 Tax=Edaphochlamys debaryana TaxID=47281 RepID=A0A835YCE1_9CHLO|nr:hypothetical protein HYH03_001915 [Edaphochlamys debaryana]|eukprot:KAG2500340.1 hypothetical protein HYH03_001915 [Edaphochlamys debaryana]